MERAELVCVECGAKPPPGAPGWRTYLTYDGETAGLVGGPKVTPHDARHAFASQMASLGLESGDVAEGHGPQSPTITERIYTHAFDRAKREARIRAAQEKAVAGERG